MTRSRAAGVAGLVAALAAAGYFVWSRFGAGDERAIRAQLEALRTEVNSSTTDGLGSISRAAKIGSYFTEDVLVNLGEGSAPIRGRLILMGMAERLQPRTAAFRMELDDVGVEIPPAQPPRMPP